jgi:hypothetical protein
MTVTWFQVSPPRGVLMPRSVSACAILRRVWGEDYEDFARRAAANPIGRNVKLADLADNCDLSPLLNQPKLITNASKNISGQSN